MNLHLGYLLYQASKFHREFIFENWILSSGRGIGQRFILCLTPVQPQLCSYLQSVKVKGCYVGQRPMTFFWYILILKMQGQITKSDWHCKKIETRYVNVRKSEKEGNWAWVSLEQVVHHWGCEAYPEPQSTTSAMLWTIHDKAIILWTRKASSELTDSFLYPMTTFHHKPISKKILKVLGRQQ